MTDSTIGYGQEQPNDTASDLGVIVFVCKQMIARLSTMKLVKVVAVYPGQGTPPAVGTVDVQLLVNQIDGNAYATKHGVVMGISYWRFQFGPWAIVADPAVNDIGYVICSDRDISAVVRSGGQQANPGSRRRMNVADGIYVGGVLNAVSPATLWLKSDGTVNITDALGNVIETSTEGIGFTPVGGPVKVNGDCQVTGKIFSGEGGGDQVSLQTHTHSGVQTGGGTSGPPTPGS